MHRPLRLLHLSDIRFRKKKDWDSRPVLRRLAEVVAQLMEKGQKLDVAVLTGDIAFSGIAEEYELAEQWLTQELMPALKLGPERILIVPGNHDIDRKKISRTTELIRNDLLNQNSQQVIQEAWNGPDVALLQQPQQAYLNFLSRIKGKKQVRSWWAYKLEHDGKTVGFAGLDSAWMSAGDRDQGQLLLGRFQLHQVLEPLRGCAYTIALLHHPKSYLKAFDGEDIWGRMQQDCHLIQHQQGLEIVAERSLGLATCGNSFQLLEIDLDSGQLAIYPYHWYQGKWQRERNFFSKDPSGVGRMQLKAAPQAKSASRGDELDGQVVPSQRTELKMLLDENGQIIPLKNNETRQLRFGFPWSRDQPGKIICFSLLLGNHNERGMVCIRDLDFRFDLADDSTSWLDTVGNLEEIFTINDRPVSNVKRSFNFLNRADSHQEVAFRHDKIRAIPQDVATITLRIHFQYREWNQAPADPDNQNWQTDVKKFEAHLHFKIERNLGPYWLAVDFGTAVTMVAFAKDNENLEIIDLQAPLSDWIGSEYSAENIQEFGTRFLASTILLRYGGAIQSTYYSNDVVHLSPSYSHAARDSDFTIPYLKLIIGLDKLPNSFNRLDVFRYRKKTTDLDEIHFCDEPLETRTLLINTYRLILRDFVRPSLEALRLTDKLNKVVISVPSTFTPRHTGYLRDLITQEFSYLSKDYLTFISESDAIAYFYLSKWNLINRARDASQKNALQPGTEYALVYDMGAGTLDLTYLRIETDGDGRKKVQILGRLGKSTAGNYLDYTIARYIHEQYEDKCIYPIFKKAFGSGKVAQIELKRFIRERIKPNLGQDVNIKFAEELTKFTTTGDVVLSTRELRESQQVQDFVIQSTKILFDNFFSLFSTIDNRHHKKGAIPLNTVLYSGGSTQFTMLREAIKQELGQWSGNPELHCVNLSDPEQGFNAASLKSAVVQGAMDYVFLFRDRINANITITSRNLLARYGVLYRDPRSSDTWRFKELLNPATRAINEASPTCKDGMIIYAYDTDRFDSDPNNDNRGNTLNLSNTSRGYFVQSYAKDTEGDMNKGHLEDITIMIPFHPTEMPPDMHRRAPIRMRIDENNEMITNLGNEESDPHASFRVDLYNSKSFQRSMWPYWDAQETQ